jgi:hypothetical protein
MKDFWLDMTGVDAVTGAQLIIRERVVDISQASNKTSAVSAAALRGNTWHRSAR